MNNLRTLLLLCCCLIGANIFAQDKIELPLCPSFFNKEMFSDGFLYPNDVVDNCIQGRAVIKFKVDSAGNVSDLSIESGVSTVYDAWLKKVITLSSGKWIPGKVNGVNASMYTTHTFTIAIRNVSLAFGDGYTHVGSFEGALFKDHECLLSVMTTDCGKTQKSYYNDGVKQYQEGHIKEAKKSFERAITMNYNDVHALFNLSIIYINNNEGAFACPYLYRIKKVGGKDVDELIKKFCDTE